MNYGTVENNISQRINDKLSELGLSEKFFAAPMPETNKEQENYEAQLAVKTCVAVEFFDTDFQPNSTLNVVRQVETPKFRLLFGGKRMRGDDGIFAMMAYCKQFLIGYTLPDTSKRLTLAGFGKIQFDPSIWLPFLDFETESINTQIIEDDTDETVVSNFKEVINAPEEVSGALDSEQFV